MSWPELNAGDCCVYCGEFAQTRDHVIPKSDGGRLTVPACYGCNQRKGSKRYVYCQNCDRHDFAFLNRRQCVRCNKQMKEVWPQFQIEQVSKQVAGCNVPFEVWNEMWLKLMEEEKGEKP